MTRPQVKTQENSQKQQIFDKMNEIFQEFGQGAVKQNKQGVFLVEIDDERNSFYCAQKRGEEVIVGILKSEGGKKEISKLENMEDLLQVLVYVGEIQVACQERKRMQNLSSELAEAMQEEPNPEVAHFSFDPVASRDEQKHK